MDVIGIDGIKGGWVAMQVVDGIPAHLITRTRLAEIVDRFGNAEVFAIDIPIGLPESALREADSAARRFLENSRSSVFAVPPRSVLAAETYAEANKTLKDMANKGLSRQAYGLARKIFEVERLANEDRRIFEVHPEVSFRAMAGEPLPSKKTWAGARKRLQLLRDAKLSPLKLRSDAPGAAFDDVLDAGAAAWTAIRIAGGRARSLPDNPPKDSRGRVVAIWY